MAIEIPTVAMESLRDAAHRYLGERLCPIPFVRSGAEKRPALSSWAHLQKRLPTAIEIDEWFRNSQANALGLVCGAASGNLEVLDFDAGGEAFEPWKRLVEECAPGLFQRLVVESTPSGGVHVLFRCEGPVGGSTKLATKRVEASGPDPIQIDGKSVLPRQDKEGRWHVQLTLIETRGEGGACIVCPSEGYRLAQGAITALPVISNDERDILLGCVGALDQTPESVIDGPPAQRPTSSGELRPGDDFSARGDVREVLRKHGWTLFRSGDNEHWTRPGKDHGTSATLKDQVFFVFTSNAPPLEPMKGYAPFAVYALLEHHGEWSAAAAALRRDGYGSAASTNPPAASRSPGAGDQNGEIELGQRDPISGRLVLSPQMTLPTAEAFVRDFHSHREGRTLHDYGGVLMEWRDNRYCPLEEGAIKNILQRCLHDALRYAWNPRVRRMELLDFQSNPTTVNHALESIRTLVHLPVTIESPSWLDGGAGRPAAIDILPCKTMSLHIPTGQILAPTPALFTTNALDFDYDADPEPPERWIKFLEQVFGDDIESVEALQEWFGYCLTPDTSQQKMLLLVGPKRSGKSTIGRVLEHLVGLANVAGPTASSFATQFGLQPLIGKSLAIVSDARFTGDNQPLVIERLLSISGEGRLTIPRKYLDAPLVKLRTRIMILTNEIPRFADPSGALAGRFIVIRTTQSFYGREDPALTDHLLAERPGILRWALDGRRRLTKRGCFVRPASAEDAVRSMEDLGSPVGAFIRDRCVLGPDHRVDIATLYEAWTRWCELQGRQHVGSRQSFGRDLAAAAPGIQSHRGTGNVSFYRGIALNASAD